MLVMRYAYNMGWYMTWATMNVVTCLFSETSAGSFSGSLLHDIYIAIHFQVRFMPRCSTATTAFRTMLIVAANTIQPRC